MSQTPFYEDISKNVDQYYSMVRVANFETLYLRHFWPKIQSFCAH